MGGCVTFGHRPVEHDWHDEDEWQGTHIAECSRKNEKLTTRTAETQNAAAKPANRTTKGNMQYREDDNCSTPVTQPLDGVVLVELQANAWIEE